MNNLNVYPIIKHKSKIPKPKAVACSGHGESLRFLLFGR